MKSHWKGVGQAASWLGQVSGNHKDRANSVSQVDGDSYMAPGCELFVGRAQKRNKGPAPASTSVWEKDAPAALLVNADNSVPLWHLSICCASAGAQRE